jgi:hypothetical protein
MKSLLVAAGALLALSFVGSSGAVAQHYGCNSGYGRGYSSPGLSVSVGYGNFGGYQSRNFRSVGFNSGFSGYRGHGYPVYGGRTHSTWHDTSHLDYHGPSLVPHRGHFDYVPGHYDLHRTGHWDTHHH